MAAAGVATAGGVTGPLAGIRVLDLTIAVSGPWAVQILADQGADVVKVEPIGWPNPKGDTGSRAAGSMGYPNVAHGMTPLFLNVNRNKRSAAMDLSTAVGRALFLRLAAKADVVVQNFRPGVVDRLGIGYEACKNVRPDIIYLSISGFGPVGPYVDMPVYDPIIQGTSGTTHMQRDYKTGRPRLVQGIVCDKVTSLTAAQAVSAALIGRLQGRGGQHIELSMLAANAAFNWVDSMNEHVALSPSAPRPQRLNEVHPMKMKDAPVAVGLVTDKQWHSFFTAVDEADAAADPRFATAQARTENGKPLGEVFQRVCARFTAAEVFARLRKHGVGVSRFLSAEEHLNDPQVAAAGIYFEQQHPAVGPVRQPRHPAVFSVTPAQPGRLPAPSVGEHTQHVLAQWLGLGDAEFAELRRGGAVGAAGAPPPRAGKL